LVAMRGLITDSLR